MRTTAIAILTLSLSFVLSACVGESTAREDLESAKDYFASGEPKAAVLELKNALRKDQALGEARWLLGMSYLQGGDSASAVKELERANSLNYNPDLTIPAYANALLAQGKFDQVARISDSRLSSPESKISLYNSQALAKLEKGENRGARELIDKIFAIDPESEVAQLAQAQLSLSVGELESAQSTLEELIVADDKNAAALKTLGRVQTLQKDNEAAAETFDKVLTLEPGNLEILHKSTMMALQNEDYKKAQQGVAKLLRAMPKDPSANFIKGFLELRAKRYDTATKHLQLAEPITAQYPQNALFLAQAHLVNGHLESAAASAERFYNLVPGSVRGRKLLTIIRLEQRDYVAAEELILPVAKANPNDTGALRLLANAQLGLQKVDQGISTLARITQLEPDSADALVRLGAGLLMDGEPEEARLHLETALELKPDHQRADFLLALSLLEQGENEKALDIVRDMAEKNPEEAMPHNLEAWILVRAGRESEARDVYERLLEKWPADPGANHALGQKALEAEDFATAGKYYEAILKGDPNHLPSLIQLGLVRAAQGNNDELVRLLEKAIEAHPKAIQPRVVLARYYLSSKQVHKVTTAFTGLDEAQRKDPEVLKLIAVAQVVSQEHSEALFTLEELNESNPDTVENYYLTGLAAAGTGDTGRAIRSLRQALKINDQHNASRLALAKLLYREDRIDEIPAHIEILSKNAPENPDVLLLQASVAEKANDLDAALGFAQQAYDIAPRSLTVLALGNYHERTGNSAVARELYSNWLEDNPADTNVRLKLAMEQTGSEGPAEAQYRELLRQEPNNPIALNNLAWILKDSNPEEALKFARQAEDVAPDNASILDTLAMVEFKNGNLEVASRKIARALMDSPDNPSMLFHKALFDHSAGRKDEARETLQALLDSGAEFDELAEAKALYNSL
jgi:putative PEP-CTERM system TPR-repeat lipoprotein